MADDKDYFRGRWVIRGWPERIAAAQEVASYSMRGEPIARVRYGEEVEDWGAGEDRPCHDCVAISGEFHAEGCDVERCRVCGGQIIGCDCPYDEGEPADEDGDGASGLN